MDTKQDGDVPRTGSGLRRWLGVAIGMLALVALAGCDDILDVSLPGDIESRDLSEPGLATTLAASAQNEFECALGAYAVFTGWWTQTLWDAGTSGGIGSRALRHVGAASGSGSCPSAVFRGGGLTPYLPLHIARNTARDAFEIIEEHPAEDLPADKSTLLATTAAYEGYATVHLGEGYCRMRLDPEGELIQPDQVLEVAADRFRTAIEQAQAASDQELLNFARVGLARTLNRLDQHQEAKTVAQNVPAGFVRHATFDGSPVRRINMVAAENNVNLTASVGGELPGRPEFSFRNLEVDGVPDPRVPVEERPDLSPRDGITAIWTQQLFPELGDDIPLATWQEAQLIIAESELEAGNAGLAVDGINRVREFYELPLYASDDLAEIREQLVEERRRQFFLQGHRLGDMLEYGVEFPTGFDHKGRSFSSETCIQIPDAEL